MLIPTEYLTGNIDIAKPPLEYVIAEENRIEVMLCLLKLSPRAERIIRLRFWEGLTLREVGELYGVNLERIRQIEAKSLRRLKHPQRTRLLRESWVGRNWYGRELPARHYVPEWKRPILAHINRFRYRRSYYDFDLRKFLQGKMSTKDLTEYFSSKEGQSW